MNSSVLEPRQASAARLLVIEDQKKMLRTLERGLTDEGYTTVAATDFETGLRQALSESIDAVVLDLMLPGRSGLELLAELRQAGFKKPVLILTARDSVDDRVLALDSGADDYLVKPFAFAELLARLRALLRRDSSRETVLKAGDLRMDLISGDVLRGGEPIELTNREFDLLEFLLRNKNSNVTRDMIARAVWRESNGSMTNVIDVYINLLRKKVEVADRQQMIVTVRGVGYSLRGE
ncbi:MAG: response regulator transcription factor [Pirellulales bacterium]|nr:response regulator transcription factor [Pirellulales bacterium]